MREFLEQVISGIAAGGIYASLALALVLIYRAMGLINFAQGEFAMFTAFICWALLEGLQLPYALAVALTIVVAAASGLAIERAIVRPFERGSSLIILIVTLALFDIANSVAGFVWGFTPPSWAASTAQSAPSSAASCWAWRSRSSARTCRRWLTCVWRCRFC